MATAATSSRSTQNGVRGEGRGRVLAAAFDEAERQPALQESREQALEQLDGLPTPFERGRTELAYGERLRRANRRRDARSHLRSALETFDELGAAPWQERARAELRATGERVPRREPSAMEKLTPQELQIALRVAEGKTNPEIAGAIFLSPKTVEFHGVQPTVRLWTGGY